MLYSGSKDVHHNTEGWHAVAYRLRHYATKRKVADSIPDELIFKFT
jgi:hypothetical protein